MYVLLFRASSRDELFSSLARHSISQPRRFSSLGEGPFRASVCYRDPRDFMAKVDLLRARAADLDQYFSLSDGVSYTSRVFSPEALAFLFPGQGSQTAKMFESFLAYPGFRQSFAQLSSRATAQGVNLQRLIYEDPGQLDQTQFAQPALAAVSWSLVELLRVHGIEAPGSAGHSFGELVALAQARAYSPEFLLDLSIQRGLLMAQENEEAPGKMLAVIDKECQDWKLLHSRVKAGGNLGSVCLANVNSPSQLVYSGSSADILLLKDRCQDRQIRCVLLSASAAFHSPLMAPAAKKLAAFLRDRIAELHPPVSRVHSNLPELSYAAPRDVAENLPRLLADEVRWIEVTEGLYAAGARIFLELGPKSVLSKLVREILPHDEVVTLSLDGAHPLEHVLAQLACLGLDPKLSEDPGANFPWEIQTDNKIISGYLAKQKNLFAEAERVRDLSLRTELQKKVITDIEEVLHLFFSLDGKSPAPAIVSPAPATDEVTTAVLREISTITGFRPEEISLEARFDSDLALDSITRMELLANLSRNFKTEASDVSAIMNANSVAELTRVLRDGGTVLKVQDEEALPEDLLWARQKISRYTGVDEDQITLGTRFSEDLMLDSLIKTELLSGLQERRGKLDFNDFTRMNSLADLASFLRGQRPAEALSGRPEKKITVFLRERLATYLGLAPEKIRSSASFEHDLGMNIFEKEDLVNSLLLHFPYLAIAGRELLHAGSLGDLLEIEALLDRRAPSRSDDEEIVRYSFVPRPLGKPHRTAGKFPEKVIVCTLTGTEVSRILSYLDEQTQVTFVPVLDHLELLRILEGEMPGAAVDLLFIVPPLATQNTEEWDAQLERFLSFLYFFASLFDLFRSRQLNLSIKLLLDGSKDVFSRSVVGMCRSMVREYPLTFSIVDMPWATELPDRLPWGLLWEGQNPDQERCRYFRMVGGQLQQEILHPEAAVAGPAFTLPLKPKIFMVGGARGIAAVVARDLADQHAARIFCVGRTDLEPVAFPDVKDREGLRVKLEEEVLKTHAGLSSDEREKLVARKLSEVLRQREIFETKSSIERRGGEFHYFRQDALDFPGLRDLVAELEAKHGHFDGVIHAAGITRDSLIKHKKLEDFKEVVVTKVRSARHIQEIFKDRSNLSFVAFFSSLSSWSGAPGQTDYALANEMVNVLAEDWNRTAPYPVSALLWSVWSEAGLASASLLQQMRTLDLTGISNRAGIRLFSEEMRTGLRSPKVLFAPRSTLQYSLKVSPL